MSNQPIPEQYQDIRPLIDSEVQDAYVKLLKTPEIEKMIPALLPDVTAEDLLNKREEINSILDFKLKISLNVLFGVIERTCFSLTTSGMSKLDEKGAYTFITNHRDIILDASFLSVLLQQHGKRLPQIAIGDNLLITDWIETLVRLNNSFIVKRAVSVREMLKESNKLSAYIRYVIKDLKESIWIAQREGRAKDSNDRTQTAMLKMLNMSSECASMLDGFKELNIVPVSLSYEYDPCDYLKAKEMLMKHRNPDHKKSKMDDYVNMKQGIVGQKGRVHFAVCDPLGDLSFINPEAKKQEILKGVANEIDRRIHMKYRLYEGNFIAYDMLHQTDIYKSHYGEKDVEVFKLYLNGQLDKIEMEDKDVPFLRERILEMYANPVINNEKAKKYDY